MNKAQTKKLKQIAKRNARKTASVIEAAFIKRACAMRFIDRLAMAWIIVKGGGRGSN